MLSLRCGADSVRRQFVDEDPSTRPVNLGWKVVSSGMSSERARSLPLLAASVDGPSSRELLEGMRPSRLVKKSFDKSWGPRTFRIVGFLGVARSIVLRPGIAPRRGFGCRRPEGGLLSNILTGSDEEVLSDG